MRINDAGHLLLVTMTLISANVKVKEKLMFRTKEMLYTLNRGKSAKVLMT